MLSNHWRSALSLLVVFSLAAMARGQSQGAAQPASGTQAQPQPQKGGESLADASRKARAKKAKAAAGKVYTDDDVAANRGSGISVVGQESSPSTGNSHAGDSAAASNKSEALWRGKARAIHEQIASVDQQIDKLKEQIKTTGGSGFDASSGLQKNVIYVDDRNGRLQRLEKKKAELQQQLDSLQEEGRKAGAPAGWFR